MVHTVDAAVTAAEKEFGVEEGRTLLMAALESPLGIMNAYEIVTASPRMFGCAISGGDFRKSMHVQIQRDGVEMMVARGQMLLAARAAGVQCFDTMYPNIDDMEGFKAEVIQNHKMGFDGKSIVNPKPIAFVHETFAPTEKEIAYAEKLVRGCQAQADAGIGVYTVDGKMVDIPFFEDAKRIIALAKACGVYHGMTFSFHTEFRDGDYVASMVAKVLVEEMGLKDLHVAATSLGSAQDIFADYMEKGIIVEAQTSGVRGRIGEVISAGKIDKPVIIRSHGSRPRAVEAGEVHIDIAFLAAATSDCCGNAKGQGGKNNCGSMGFANHDAHFADHTVIITDTLVPFPNLPSSISCIDVDAVCVVDAIGDPKKIATKEARMTDNPRELMMAENVANVIAATPYFKDGFSFQTGVGGPSLAVNRFLEEHMKKAGNKGAYVNKLDYVVLSALEIDTKFNVNVITGSDGVLRGAPGGHPDTAAVYVGLGLADITIGDHIKYSLKFVWPMSILTLIASTLLGVIPF